MPKTGYVYILTNFFNTVSYIGVTSNLPARIYQHKQGLVEGFTKRYNIHKLVYCEELPTIEEAIAAEKKLKGWSRAKKMELICKNNPGFAEIPMV